MPVQQLPDSVRRLLDQQGSGFYDTPQQQSNQNQAMSGLQQAAGRRFGQSGEFDQEYDQGIRGLMSQVPDLEAGFQNRRQRMDEDFTQSAEKADRDKTMDDDRHTNSMADRGMGHSGANLVGQGRIAEGFQRGVQGLVSNRSRGLSDLTGAQNAAYRQIESRSGELQGQAAGRATARDQQRAWQAEQVRMQQESAKMQQEQAQRQLEFNQQAQAANEAAQRRMEDMMRQQSQPVANSGGSYQAAPPPPPQETQEQYMRRIMRESLESTRLNAGNYNRDPGGGGGYIGNM